MGAYLGRRNATYLRYAGISRRAKLMIHKAFAHQCAPAGPKVGGLSRCKWKWVSTYTNDCVSVVQWLTPGLTSTEHAQ